MMAFVLIPGDVERSNLKMPPNSKEHIKLVKQNMSLNMQVKQYHGDLFIVS